MTAHLGGGPEPTSNPGAAAPSVAATMTGMPAVPGPQADITIGVVLPLPEPYAQDVRWMRREAGDPQADVIPPHITLVPPIRIRQHDLPAAITQLTEVTDGYAPFEVHLRGVGTFRPLSPVVFLDPVAGVTACAHLNRAVRGGLLAYDSLFPYRPHVTIAHLNDDAALDRALHLGAGYDIRYQADGIGLYVWHADQTWRLHTVLPFRG
ncbi:MAG: hypothetical protein CSA58_08360 [Micrococcales bacterium]|nr:MAG: hypothetical protein CSA58_08360 [Micrococcales bacterium]